MNALLQLLGFVALSFCSVFLAENVLDAENGVGYHFLGGAGVLALALLMLGARFGCIKRIKKSMLLAATFLAYFIIKLLIDVDDYEKIRAYTIGTSGGIVFSLLFGLMVSFIISDICMRTKRESKLIGLSYILSYSALVMILFAYAFKEHYLNVREDLFLVQDRVIYQRPGDFLFMQFMISSVMIVLAKFFSNSLGVVEKLVLNLFGLIIYISTALIMMMLSQLIGSNSGFAAIGGLTFVTLVYYSISGNVKFKRGALSYKFKNILLGSVGKILCRHAFVVVIAFIVVGFVVLSYLPIDISSFRIVGFGKGVSTSITSRVGIFKNNFVDQFAYNPIFGNIEVQIATTGEDGTYVHSLLSILTHLGLVGFLIFLALLTAIYFELIGTSSTGESYYDNRPLAFFRLMVLAAVIVFALVSAFFTWMPLWFSVGLFGISLANNRRLTTNNASKVINCGAG